MAGPGKDGHDFVLRCIDGDGRPVADARVGAWQRVPRGEHHYWRLVWSQVFCDKSGLLQVRLSDGRYRFRIRAPGFVGCERVLRVEDPTETTFVMHRSDCTLQVALDWAERIAGDANLSLFVETERAGTRSWTRVEGRRVTSASCIVTFADLAKRFSYAVLVYGIAVAPQAARVGEDDCNPDGRCAIRLPVEEGHRVQLDFTPVPLLSELGRVRATISYAGLLGDLFTEGRAVEIGDSGRASIGFLASASGTVKVTVDGTTYRGQLSVKESESVRMTPR